LTDKERQTLGEIPLRCGFADGAPAPNDSRCPVTKYRHEFVPSRLLDEARSGWFPRGIRHCLCCELCSPRPDASCGACADEFLLFLGPREGNFPRAFGGALDAVVELQITKQGAGHRLSETKSRVPVPVLTNENRQNRLGWITPDLQVADGSKPGDVALFVGCAPYYDVLLEERQCAIVGAHGSAPTIGFRATDEARAAVELLNSVGVRPVVLGDEVCCGGDRLHAGDREGFTALGERNRDLLRERGVRTVVTGCDDCRYTLGNRYPRHIEGWNFEVVRLADFLVQRGGRLAFMPTRESVAVQPPDPFSDPAGIGSVRRILARIPSLDVREIEPGHPSTFGGWGQLNSVSKRLETDLLKAAQATGATKVLVPGTRMLVRLLEGRRPGSWEETSIAIKAFYGFLVERHTVAAEFTGA